MGRVGSDGSGFGDMQFATDYNNGITYVINVLSVRVGSGRQFRVHDGSGHLHNGSGRVQKRVTRGQLCMRQDGLVCVVAVRSHGKLAQMTRPAMGRTRYSILG